MTMILVLAEHDGGTFKTTASELLGKASELGATVAAAVVGDADAASLGAFGATKAFQVSGDFAANDTLRITRALEAIVAAANPDVLLAPASYWGKDVLPRLAARLGSGMATECTDLRTDGDALIGTRPMAAGKVYANVTVGGSPAIFTVRPNSFSQPAGGGGAAEVASVDVSYTDADTAVTTSERRRPESSAVDLTEASRIVSGGRSLASPENFDEVIRPLAASIGATVGASRAAVDAGFAPHSEQVGQTGKTVNPQLYIAVGISGAIQHLAGMRTSKVIVAINKDPEAPIFEHATYGIVADLFEVVPALTKAFNEL